MTTEINVQTRPMFLKVLCILSFVGIGINILVALFGLIYSSIVDTSSIDASNPLYFFAYTGSMSLKNLIVELFSLIGVILMWRLHKIGFFIYLVAESFLYFEFIYTITTNDVGAAGATQIGLEMIWPLPLDIAFFIMYAIQLKHMTRQIKTVTTADK
jgi:hypothetical protein